jgi:hypothetical protein
MQANRLLASLPRKSYRDLLPGLATVTLEFGDVLYEPGARIRDVYFPGRSVVSLLTVVDGHSELEVGLVGWEGMVGIPLALGVDVSPVRALVQGGGAAMQMSAAGFRKALNASAPLRQACIAMPTPHGADHPDRRLQPVPGRGRARARLLMTRDRVGSAQFRLTGFSAYAGVRRVG